MIRSEEEQDQELLVDIDEAEVEHLLCRNGILQDFHIIWPLFVAL